MEDIAERNECVEQHLAHRRHAIDMELYFHASEVELNKSTWKEEKLDKQHQTKMSSNQLELSSKHFKLLMLLTTKR